MAMMPNRDMAKTMAIRTKSTWAREWRFSVIVKRRHLLHGPGEDAPEQTALPCAVFIHGQVPPPEALGDPHHGASGLAVIADKEIVLQLAAAYGRIFRNGAYKLQVEDPGRRGSGEHFAGADEFPVQAVNDEAGPWTVFGLNQLGGTLRAAQGNIVRRGNQEEFVCSGAQNVAKAPFDTGGCPAVSG